MTEQEKFNLLLAIIRLTCTVKLIYRNSRDLDRPNLYNGYEKLLRGECIYDENKIYQYLIPDMNEEEWSEASSSLLHEYGHCMKYEPHEKQAWTNAKKWVEKNFQILKPKLFDKVMKDDLEIYKQMTKKKYVFSLGYQY